MSYSLERVSTVNQTSLGSTRLPLELQQQVFAHLDTRSFYAASRTCKWWRFASLDAVTLSRQLRKLPILPAVDKTRANPIQLQRLFHEAAHTLLVNLQVDRQADGQGLVGNAFQLESKATASSDGSRTVILSDRTITLFDTSSSTPVALATRPLNDLKETVGNGPWLKTSSTAANHLTLSSTGRLLAIAQERTIQVYDLLADPDSFTVNEYVPSASGHYIEGIDFEQNDRMLRVRLSGKGTVVYLGSPSPSDDQTADLDHWKSKSGLRHTFIDSSKISLPSKTTSDDQTSRITGLQLLRGLENGFLLAGQHHGGGESSHYALAHVTYSTPTKTIIPTAELDSFTILARLESFLSAWRYSLQGQHERGLGLWENMPCAHEHAPRFALSPDGRSLILAEREKKKIRPYGLTQLFVYRVPNTDQVRKILAEKRQTQKEAFLARVEKETGKDNNMAGEIQEDESTMYSIGRIPLCLTTVQGDVAALKFSSVPCDQDVMTDGQESKSVMLSAMTHDSTKSWILTDL